VLPDANGPGQTGHLLREAGRRVHRPSSQLIRSRLAGGQADLKVGLYERSLRFLCVSVPLWPVSVCVAGSALLRLSPAFFRIWPRRPPNGCAGSALRRVHAQGSRGRSCRPRTAQRSRGRPCARASARPDGQPHGSRRAP
jgi:hypothetical protein